jgi:ribosomal protein S18 acetylase RimI-like enzyme
LATLVEPGEADRPVVPSTVVAVELRNANRDVRARIGSWPYEPDVGHLVLLDHHMVPSAADVAGWIDAARGRRFRSLRTGALFPHSVPVFADAGFEVIDQLTLLERDITRAHRLERRGAEATRPMRSWHLAEAAELDRSAFGPRWGNDRAALVDVQRATPRHRSRLVIGGRPIAGFAISGIADRSGYLQRLAVAPDARRQGVGRSLVLDALTWMQQHGARQALVNTASDNSAGLALYASLGFRARDESLTILEFELTPG